MAKKDKDDIQHQQQPISQQRQLQQQIAQTLTERSIWVRFGWLLLRVRPLTLAQLYRIGEIVADIDQCDFKGAERINPTKVALERYSDFQLCQQVAVHIIFRSRLWRTLLGRFIRSRLTMPKYQQLIAFATHSMNASFFLTSLLSLKGIKQMTQPTRTANQTAHGDSWVEL
jgi:hypothetical protein